MSAELRRVNGRVNAEELNAYYAGHLERMMQPPVPPHVNVRWVRHMLKLTRRLPARYYREERPTWRRTQRLRTLAELPVQVELRGPPKTPVYQQIAAEAAEMPARGLCVSALVRHFGVDHHTVEKALRWFRKG